MIVLQVNQIKPWACRVAAAVPHSNGRDATKSTNSSHVLSWCQLWHGPTWIYARNSDARHANAWNARLDIYIIYKVQTHPTQIVKVYFFIKKNSFSGFLKIIVIQNLLPITFCSNLVCRTYQRLDILPPHERISKKNYSDLVWRMQLIIFKGYKFVLCVCREFLTYDTY